MKREGGGEGEGERDGKRGEGEREREREMGREGEGEGEGEREIGRERSFSPLQQVYHNQVIVMELCTGGSLYDVIDSPENAYGLSEAEFKQVVYVYVVSLVIVVVSWFQHVT